MRKFLFICLIILSINPLYADPASKQLENETAIRHEVKFGIGDEFYDVGNDDIYDGGTPHALTFNFNYIYDQGREKDFLNLRPYYLLVDFGFKLEEDAEKYDSTRDPYSIDAKLEALVPVYEIKKSLVLNFVSGLRVQMNGPQINDNAYVAHVGLQLDKYINTSYGPFIGSALIAGARYYYEVDDEPAKEQTGTSRELLDHEGNGVLYKIKLEYRPGKNRLNLAISHLSADDEKQGGDYERNEFEANISRLFTKNTKCSVTFSITEHKYGPQALLHDDLLFSPGTSCSYLF